mmetsp:Transcript_20636/g.65850  ORF Transcript_20636/g.65850 Transcript_20636/m.65850 type:complete len:276 (+) Transcript_20636:1345-2172(+)
MARRGGIANDACRARSTPTCPTWAKSRPASPAPGSASSTRTALTSWQARKSRRATAAHRCSCDEMESLTHAFSALHAVLPPRGRSRQLSPRSSSDAHTRAAKCPARSDLKRAMDTTIAIIGSDSPVVADARLREIHAGDFEGKTIREVATDEATKQAWQAFVSDRSFRAPNGESHDDHMARCAAALDDLVLKAAAIDKVSGGKRRLLFVAHGGVMHCVHKHMRKDFSGKSSPHAGNCSIGVVDATVDCDTIMDWSLRRWNDVAHLQAVQTASSTI